MIFIWLLLAVGFAGGYEAGNFDTRSFIWLELLTTALLGYEIIQINKKERSKKCKK